MKDHGLVSGGAPIVSGRSVAGLRGRGAVAWASVLATLAVAGVTAWTTPFHGTPAEVAPLSGALRGDTTVAATPARVRRAGGARLFVENLPAGVSGVNLSPDGKCAALAGAGPWVPLLDVVTGKEIARFARHAGTATAAVFSPDGKQLITGGTDRAIRVWDRETGAQVRVYENFQKKDESLPITRLLISADGRSLAAHCYNPRGMTDKLFGRGPNVYLFDRDAPAATPRRNFRNDAGDEAIALSPDGSRLYYVVGKDVRVESPHEAAPANAKPVRWPTGLAGVKTLTLSPDGKLLLCVGRESLPKPKGADKDDEPNALTTVRVLDAATGAVVHTLTAEGPGGRRYHEPTAQVLADGKRVLVGAPGMVKLLSLETGATLAESREDGGGFTVTPDGARVVVLPPQEKRRVDLAPGIEHLASAALPYFLTLPDLKLVGSLYEPRVAGGMTEVGWTPRRPVAFSPDGRYLCLATNVGIWQFDLTTGAGRLAQPADPARPGMTAVSVGFSPDSKTAYSLFTTLEGYVAYARDPSSVDAPALVRADRPNPKEEGKKDDDGAMDPATAAMVLESFGEYLSGLGYSIERFGMALPEGGGPFVRRVGKDMEVIELLDPATGRVTRSEKPQAMNEVSIMKDAHCAVSPDGKYLAYVVGSTVRIWNWEKKRWTQFEPTSDGKARNVRKDQGGDAGIKVPRPRLPRLPKPPKDPREDIEKGKDAIQRGEWNPLLARPGFRAFRFSRDGKYLLHDRTLYDVGDPDKSVTLETVRGAAVFGDFAANAPRLVIGEATPGDAETAGRIIVLDADTQATVREFPADEATTARLSPDGKLLVVGSADACYRLYSVDAGRELCQIVVNDDGSWACIDPEGRFDANRLDQLAGAHWVLPDAPNTPYPLEVFLRQYFTPGLLRRALVGETLPDVPPVGRLNRLRPRVEIVSITAEGADTSTVTVRVTPEEADAKSSGARDLRLFRDGQLAALKEGPLSAGEHTFRGVALPQDGRPKVQFSAYAFNSDRLKGETTSETFLFATNPNPRPRRAYLICVGVDSYEGEAVRDLRCAVADADSLAKLTGRVARSGGYDEVIAVSLLSPPGSVPDVTVTPAPATKKPEPKKPAPTPAKPTPKKPEPKKPAPKPGRKPAATGMTVCHDGEGVPAFQNSPAKAMATRARLRAVLAALTPGANPDMALLAGVPGADQLRPARPDDAVIVTFSGHGFCDRNSRFYLVPSDLGANARDLRDPATAPRCVSADDLADWLRPVDAGVMALIVDACHSAAAVDAGGFRPGPMGDPGFGQLAYDKRMFVLAATQAADYAIESERVGHGILTYSLVKEGLDAGRADLSGDGAVDLGEWFRYAVRRTPEIHEAIKDGKEIKGVESGVAVSPAPGLTAEGVRKTASERPDLQHPALFDFSLASMTPVRLLGTPLSPRYVATDAPAREYGPPVWGPVGFAALSPDGTRYAASLPERGEEAENALRRHFAIWDVKTGKVAARTGAAGMLCGFTDGGTALFVVDRDNKGNARVTVWDAATGKKRRDAPGIPSYDGTRHLTCKADGSVREVGSGGAGREIVTASAFAAGVARREQVGSLSGGEGDDRKKDKARYQARLAVPSPRGNVVTVLGERGDATFVACFDAATGKLVYEDAALLFAPAFGADGAALLYPTAKRGLVRANEPTGPDRLLPVPAVFSGFAGVRLSPDDRTVALPGLYAGRRVATLYDAETGRQRVILRPATRLPSAFLYDLCFSPDGGRIYCYLSSTTGSGPTALVFDARDGAEITRLYR